MPKIFWEYIEDGKMKEITKGILVGTVQNKDYEKKVKEVGQSVKKYVNMKNAGHASYGWGFLGAQVMNLCVVLISFYLCNDFLGGNFSMLGYHFYKEIIDSVIFLKFWPNFFFLHSNYCCRNRMCFYPLFFHERQLVITNILVAEVDLQTKLPDVSWP